jgi:hypothetical protein
MIREFLTLPPGKYFIGDPSFVLDNDWKRILQISSDARSGVRVELDDSMMWAAPIENTKRKIFTDQNDVEYQSIGFYFGAVPIEMVENPEGEEHGAIVEAPNGIQVGCVDGVFRFNDIVIDTNEPGADPGNGHELSTDDDQFI